MRFLAIIAFCVPTASLACDEVIQRCTFNGGVKTVEVCLNQDTVTYAFGPTDGTPELALAVSIADADYIPWPGVGNSIWEAIRFNNENWSYVVSAGVQKLQEGQDELAPAFGGITVLDNNKYAAELTCDVGSVEWAGFGTGGIYGAKTDLGQCFDQGEGEWIACE